ncbi:MAG: hypothetical protein HC765_11805 [Brachymonas sp.]|nr:hypothetical protein [Brachymonas sp.]
MTNTFTLKQSMRSQRGLACARLSLGQQNQLWHTGHSLAISLHGLLAPAGYPFAGKDEIKHVSGGIA